MNPIRAAHRVASDFLKYQLTAFPFSDSRLYGQLRGLLRVDDPLESPLLEGPYVSLSRAFRQGPALRELAQEGVVHPHVPNLFPMERLHGHQDKAIRAIAAGRNAVVSTGTGSGKTECFLVPIVSHCLRLRDAGEPPGIRAVIVYPMNALAEDQLLRLRELLVGTGIPFAMYVGKTPERESDVTGLRCGPSRDDYQAKLEDVRKKGEKRPVLPPEEVASREVLRTPGKQPRILLTNTKMLELLLTRATDVELFQGARLDFLVVDEAHTFRGAEGAEAALLMRRLRSYCGQTPSETRTIATSATLADPEEARPAEKFMRRFFGLDEEPVEVVNEEYEADEWKQPRFEVPPMSAEIAADRLDQCLQAVGKEDDEAKVLIQDLFRRLMNRTLSASDWRDALYEELRGCENAYRLAMELESPRPLADLCERLGITAEEVLLWLAMGSVARRNGRPLLRPVVHVFVRGIDGAVVGYPEGSNAPKLWLSREDAGAEFPGLAFLSVMACTTCGQHYYQTWLKDYVYSNGRPTGGDAQDDGVVWTVLEEAQGGCRAVLTDPFRLPADPENEEGDARLPKGAALIEFCRRCGALNRGLERCGGCGTSGLVTLWAVQMDGSDQPAKMSKCLSCGAGQRFVFGQMREPARPVRATVASDVHVLSQSLLQHASRQPPRLLVFADSRQDAAFQAGWMRDHARRYRLRGLLDEILREEGGPIGLDDIVGKFGTIFDGDEKLSRALIPEVWEEAEKTPANRRHDQERGIYLKLFLMRELAVQQRQRAGLEPWGRMRVDYVGLSDTAPFVCDWSARLGFAPAELLEGIRALLDIFRRRYCLFDKETRVFTDWIDKSHRWVQNLYIPMFDGAPAAIKLRRSSGEQRIVALTGPTRQSPGDRAAQLWGVSESQHDAFIDQLWRYLVESQVILPVEVRGSDGRRVRGFDDAFQVDAGRVTLAAQSGTYRCRGCGRSFCRPLPDSRCLHFRCRGKVVREEEDSDNFDLTTLRESYTLVRPREHSAQVPAAERERIEIAFKGGSEEVNTIVCTPTLELGVDIGALDTILLRNVPPLPSNYWQRVGRAGRRHRIALNVTYARPTRHDRPYFKEPMRILSGKVEAPRFNLENPVMVDKHVRSIVLASLHRLARAADGHISEPEREALRSALKSCLPGRIAPLLFHDGGNGDIRDELVSVGPIREQVERHRDRLLRDAREVFSRGWPKEAVRLVSNESLIRVVDSFGDDLAAAYGRVFRRLKWVQGQIARLSEVQARRGSLDGEEGALLRRCTEVVKRLRGETPRDRSLEEGIDDSLTYAILAVEGFLPGYGLEAGGVRGYANPYHARSFVLHRPTAMAIREFVPGNLIYANGRRFYTSRFEIGVGTDAAIRTFVVDPETEALFEATGATGVAAQSLEFIAACDVHLEQQSLISDEEENRFMMPVSVFVRDEGIHGAGQAFGWGERTLDWRPQCHLVLANVGEAGLARRGTMGYLVCTVCGQARSPYASCTEVQKFSKMHTDRCGRPPKRYGIYARAVVDTLRLHGCTRTEAYSVGEALRIGASRVLEMETEDLDLAAVPTPEHGEDVDLLILDPMPGGSGLLQQMLEKWPEVVSAALEVVENCPSQCEASCIDCLQSYFNQQYHGYLNRAEAARRLRELGDTLKEAHAIPAKIGPAPPNGKTTNRAEERLLRMLLRAGFPAPRLQHRIELPEISSFTVVDFYFECKSDQYKGVCLYLDGLSYHTDEAAQERDRRLRSALSARDYCVLVVSASELVDRGAMSNCFASLARAIEGRSEAQRVRDQVDSWWDGGVEA